MLDPWLGAFRDYYFDDIEAKKDVGITEQAQPGESTAGNPLSLVPVYGLERPAKIFSRPGFHLDENQGVAIAADEIDLSADATPKVTRQNLVSVPAQKVEGQLLGPRS